MIGAGVVVGDYKWTDVMEACGQLGFHVHTGVHEQLITCRSKFGSRLEQSFVAYVYRSNSSCVGASLGLYQYCTMLCVLTPGRSDCDSVHFDGRVASKSH